MNFTKTELAMLSDLARHRSLAYRIDGNKTKMETFIDLAERLECAANKSEHPTDIVDTPVGRIIGDVYSRDGHYLKVEPLNTTGISIGQTLLYAKVLGPLHNDTELKVNQQPPVANVQAPEPLALEQAKALEEAYREGYSDCDNEYQPRWSRKDINAAWDCSFTKGSADRMKGASNEQR